MENKEISICLTGHRPTKLGGYNNFKNAKRLEDFLYNLLLKVIPKYQKINLSSGLALGADTCWSKAILRVKEKYPDKVAFHAHIPNYNQSNKWIKQEDKEYWDYQIFKADEVHCIDKDNSINPIATLQIRNQSMVDMSDVVIGIWDGTKGGTLNCLKYAQKKDRKIFIFSPEDIFK